jgi:hypothetical protein
MTGDHHDLTARRATLLITATDEILGTHSIPEASRIASIQVGLGWPRRVDGLITDGGVNVPVPGYDLGDVGSPLRMASVKDNR